MKILWWNERIFENKWMKWAFAIEINEKIIYKLIEKEVRGEDKEKKWLNLKLLHNFFFKNRIIKIVKSIIFT